MNYLLVFLILGLLILVHEWGHFAAARLVGIPVARFSVGFGPKLWGFTRRGTDYWLSAVPLGGYVLPDVADDDAFLKIPAARRLAFYLAGPLANVLFCLPCFALLNCLTANASAYSILVAPWVQTWELLVRMVEVLPRAFAHPDSLSGVVGIVVEGGQFIGGNFQRLVQFLVLMSLNLAIFNLLPIPVLDGGKVVLLAAERWLKNPRRLYVPLTLLGWGFILLLFLYVTVMDVARHIG